MNLHRYMRVGWLDDFGNWLLGILTAIWDAVVELLHDMVIFLLDGVLQLASIVVNAIQAPDFLLQYSLASLLGNAGGTVVWIVGTFNIGTGLSIIAGAYVFRLTRKVLTLFQW